MKDRFCRVVKGNAAIEFAFIGPILFILILGLVDLGRYFWIASEVDHAIEAVLRDAAVKKNLSESELTSSLKARLDNVSESPFTISTIYTSSTSDTPRLLTINISSSFKPLGFLSFLALPIGSTGQIPIIDVP
jgi:Flp pilus assembly protein TadG